MWKDEQPAVLADAYRAAAIVGADMRRVADDLECVREALNTDDGIYGAWDAVDDAVAHAYGQPQLPICLDLRRRFFEHLFADIFQSVKQEIASDPNAGCRAYLNAYADSIVYWRPEVHEVLAREQVDCSAPFSSVMDMIRTHSKFVLEEKWMDAYPLYVLLSDLDILAPKTRTLLYLIAAEIQIYHMKPGPETRRLIERADALTPNAAATRTVLGEYLLSQGDGDEARACAERAIAVDPKLSNAYSLLRECAERVKDFAAAEKACRDSIRMRPGNAQGYRELIELAGKLSAPNLLDEIPELADRIINAEPRSERRILLAAGYAFQQQSDLEKAGRYFRELQRRHPTYSQGFLAEGYLLQDQRKTAEAREAFELALKLFPDDPDVYRGLALIADIEGDWPAAEKFYRELIARSSRPTPVERAKAAQMRWRQGHEQEGEREILGVLKEYPDDEAAKGIAERIADAIRSQRGTAEAVRFCDRLFEAAGESQRAWYENKVGELHYEAAEYAEALKHYRTACLLEPGRVAYHVNLARALRQGRYWKASRSLLDSAPAAVQSDASFSREIVLLRNDEANALFAEGKYADAIPLYEEAIQRDGSDAILHSNLSDAWEHNTKTAAVERFDRAIAALRKAAALDPDSNKYPERIQALQRRRSRVQSFGERILKLYPVVTPIAIEVAADLVPLVEGAHDGGMTDDAARLFEGMRKELKKQYGVTIPGVRLRGNAGDLPAGSYIIIILEVPIVMGTISKDSRMAAASADDLAKLGISAKPAIGPNGMAGVSWVAPEHWAAVEQAGVELWTVFEYVVRHLAYVLSRNLAEFMGHQESSNLLGTTSEALRNRMMAKPAALSTLTSVLRALLEEQISIAAFEPLLEHFLDLLEAGLSRVEIVEALRSSPAICVSLPANREPTRLYRAAANLCAAVRTSLHSDDGSVVLAMKPELCQEALAAVRNHIDHTPAVALIVDAPDVRPFTRKLVEIEFPYLSVISAPELLPGFESRFEGEVGLET